MSKDDWSYGGDSKTCTTRSPVVADPQSGGLFQTGQGGRPVLPPITSSFPISSSSAPDRYTNQYSQRASSSRPKRRWSNPSPQEFTCYDNQRHGPAPSSPHEAYMMPQRVSQSLPSNMYYPPQSPVSRPSSVHVEEGPLALLDPSMTAAPARDNSKKATNAATMDSEEYTSTLARKECANDSIFLAGPFTNNNKQIEGENLTSAAKAYPFQDRSGIYVDVRRENPPASKEEKECCSCCTIQ